LLDSFSTETRAETNARLEAILARADALGIDASSIEDEVRSRQSAVDEENARRDLFAAKAEELENRSDPTKMTDEQLRDAYNTAGLIAANDTMPVSTSTQMDIQDSTLATAYYGQMYKQGILEEMKARGIAVGSSNTGGAEWSALEKKSISDYEYTNAPHSAEEAMAAARQGNASGVNGSKVSTREEYMSGVLWGTTESSSTINARSDRRYLTDNEKADFGRAFVEDSIDLDKVNIVKSDFKSLTTAARAIDAAKSIPGRVRSAIEGTTYCGPAPYNNGLTIGNNIYLPSEAFEADSLVLKDSNQNKAWVVHELQQFTNVLIATTCEPTQTIIN